MYSRNDYRYYLENRLMHSDDFLAHYGVKGMKWKHHKGIGQEMKDIRYDLKARQVGKYLTGTTVHDPVKNTYKRAPIIGGSKQERHYESKHNSESGHYAIKRRTTKSNLFKAIDGKERKTNAKKEKKAAIEKRKKRQGKYKKPVKLGYEYINEIK